MSFPKKYFCMQNGFFKIRSRTSFMCNFNFQIVSKIRFPYINSAIMY